MCFQVLPLTLVLYAELYPNEPSLAMYSVKYASQVDVELQPIYHKLSMAFRQMTVLAAALFSALGLK